MKFKTHIWTKGSESRNSMMKLSEIKRVIKTARENAGVFTVKSGSFPTRGFRVFNNNECVISIYFTA